MFCGAFQARSKRRTGALTHAQAQLQVVQALAAVRAHPGAIFEQLRAGKMRWGTPGGKRGESLREAANILGAPLLPVVFGKRPSCPSGSGVFPGAFPVGCVLRVCFPRIRHQLVLRELPELSELRRLPEFPKARVSVHRLLQGNAGAQVQGESA